MTSNDYDRACDRMEQARRGVRHAKREAERIIREADLAWTEADRALTAFEASPGIPRPEYRETA